MATRTRSDWSSSARLAFRWQVRAGRIAEFQQSLVSIIREHRRNGNGPHAVLVRPLELAASSLIALEFSFPSLKDAAAFLDEHQGTLLPKLVTLSSDDVVPITTIMFDVAAFEPGG